MRPTGEGTRMTDRLRPASRRTAWAALFFLWIGLWIGVTVPHAQQATLTEVVSGLSRPVAYVQDPTDPTVQFVVEQGGRIKVVKNGLLLPTDFLDLTPFVASNLERGLLSLAFPQIGRASCRERV